MRFCAVSVQRQLILMQARKCLILLVPGAGIEPARLAAWDFECNNTTKTHANNGCPDRYGICVTFCVTPKAIEMAALRGSEYILSSECNCGSQYKRGIKSQKNRVTVHSLTI